MARPAAASGARIRAARLLAAVPIRAAAAAIGVTPATLMNWERGRQAPRAERAARIAQVLRAPDLMPRLCVPYGVAAKRDALEGPRDGSLPFGDLLRLERCRLGWRQLDLATHAGVSRATISQYETGKSLPQSLSWVRWLERAMGCDLAGAYLRTRDGERIRAAGIATNRAMWAEYQRRRAAGECVSLRDWPAIWRAERRGA